MKDMGRHLLKGISFAHNNIIQGLDDVWDAGTTTLLGKRKVVKSVLIL